MIDDAFFVFADADVALLLAARFSSIAAIRRCRFLSRYFRRC